MPGVIASSDTCSGLFLTPDREISPGSGPVIQMVFIICIKHFQLIVQFIDLMRKNFITNSMIVL